MTQPITDVREISRIAYGFMGSKALFAALNIDLFGKLAGGPKPLEHLVSATAIAQNRLKTLLAALVSIGRVVKDGPAYRNAPASERYLVRSAPAYFADYYRFQVERQIYPALAHLDAGVAGDTTRLAFDSLAGLTDSPEEADAFTRAQHAGSLGPALMLAKSLELNGAQQLLDAGGGSGAFSIALCQKNLNLRAAVLDFPNVITVAKRFVQEANLLDRISFIPGDAMHTPWPDAQDVVVMSYLLSAVSEESFPVLLKKALVALRPGGRLLIHDFMLEDSEDGPALAALWFLQYLAGRVDGISFSAADIGRRLQALGYEDITSYPLIHEITKVVVCRRPGG
jgi:2-hydroxy-4-(methylsulfanyl)butanoate S-methyltransferase